VTSSLDDDWWHLEQTAAAYVAFTRRHRRYQLVSSALVDTLDLRTAREVVDVGAGTGLTVSSLLEHLGTGTRVVAVEPSAAMRCAADVDDKRVRWATSWPDHLVDVVTCSAAWWLLPSPIAALTTWASQLRPGGQLAFSVPSLFVGLPDGDDDDDDGGLHELVSCFLATRSLAPAATRPPPAANDVETHLRQLGLQSTRHDVAVAWSFDMQADWLRLPPVGLAMRPDLSLDDLDDAVHAAVKQVPEARRRGRRTERWTMWTASRSAL